MFIPILCVPVELIGEEIYDEFDPEGGHHGDASQYFPSSVGDNLNLLKRKGSAPNLTSTGPESTITSTSPTTTATAPANTSKGSNVLRPIALPALKNLSFLRSRSAPPTPRDSSKTAGPGSGLETVQSHPEDSKVEPSITEGTVTTMDEKEKMKMEDAATAAGTTGTGPGTTSPPIVITPPSSPPHFPPTPSAPAPNVAGSGIIPSAGLPGVTAGIGPNIPRSGSPAPSLGAIILDRGRQKRAAQTGGGGGGGIGGTPIVAPIASPRAVTPSVSGGKGQRFKSSPLVPGSMEGQSAARGGSGMGAVSEDADAAGNQADDEGWTGMGTGIGTEDEKEGEM